MKRIARRIKSKPTAILTADWHLREDVPKCRLDDFGKTLTRKVRFIKDLQDQYDNIPILVAGDLFHRSKPRAQELSVGSQDFNLLTWCFQNLPDNMIVIAGQHDLPNHNLDLIGQSNLSVLATAGKIRYRSNNLDFPDYIGQRIGLFYFPFGRKIENCASIEDSKFNVAMVHDMIYRRNQDYFPGIEETGKEAHALLKKYDYNLILSGDNHTPFVLQYENKLLVNPGSIYRSTAAQKDHKPRVYLWYAEENRVEPVFIPIDENVIDTSYIEIEKQKNEKIQDFAEKLQATDELDVNFSKNIQRYFRQNRTHKRVQEVVNSCIEL